MDRADVLERQQEKQRRAQYLERLCARPQRFLPPITPSRIKQPAMEEPQRSSDQQTERKPLPRPLSLQKLDALNEEVKGASQKLVPRRWHELKEELDQAFALEEKEERLKQRKIVQERMQRIAARSPAIFETPSRFLRLTKK